MFLFGLLGLVLFLLAGLAIIPYMSKPETKGLWRLIVCMVLSCICSLLYLFDIILIYLFGY